MILERIGKPKKQVGLLVGTVPLLHPRQEDSFNDLTPPKTKGYRITDDDIGSRST